MIGPHPRFRHPSMFLQLRHPGEENRVLPGRHRPARCGNPNPTDRSLISGGNPPPPHPAAPREDLDPSPVQTSFRISTTPTSWERKSISPGSTSPRTVWKPQSHGPIAERLGSVEQPQPGEDRAPFPFDPPQSRRTRGGLSLIPGSEILPYVHNSDTRGRKSSSPGRVLPCTVWKPAQCGNPNPSGRSLIGWGA